MPFGWPVNTVKKKNPEIDDNKIRTDSDRNLNTTKKLLSMLIKFQNS